MNYLFFVIILEENGSLGCTASLVCTMIAIKHKNTKLSGLLRYFWGSDMSVIDQKY